MQNIATSENFKEIENSCREFAAQYGFEYFIYADIYPTSFVEPTVIVVNGFPLEWREHYVKNSYVSIDPVVVHCATRSSPLLWEDIWKTVKKNSPEHKLMQEACDFGLCSGVSFAIHAPQTTTGIFSLASSRSIDEMRKPIEAALPHAQLFGINVHEALDRAIRKSDTSENASKMQISTREKQCLTWVADGKTSSEVSKLLNISEPTVIFHLQNAAKKLGAANRIQAVAQAIAHGIVKPNL